MRTRETREQQYEHERIKHAGEIREEEVGRQGGQVGGHQPARQHLEDSMKEAGIPEEELPQQCAHFAAYHLAAYHGYWWKNVVLWHSVN
jgi:hypothetical protein